MKNTPVLLGLAGVATMVLLAGAAASPRARAKASRAVERVGHSFTWADLSVSAAAAKLGLVNTPTPAARQALAVLVAHVLDPLSFALGRRVVVTSGYRSLEVNRAVGGSETSQHTLGEAVDIQVDGLVAEQLARVVVRSGFPFDQLIWYAPERGGHVHISLTARRPNRGQTLHAPRGDGYVPWRAR